MHSPDVVVVGRIGAPHGVQGWVRVTSFTEPPDNLLGYRPWLLEAADGWRELQPAEVRPHKGGFVARFPGLEDRDEAAPLAGKNIAIYRAQLPELGADEYYWRDLEGLAVCNRGSRLGVVDHLLDTGANSVLVVRHPDADAQTLIPFVAQYVLRVDLAGGCIEVDWEEAQ